MDEDKTLSNVTEIEITPAEPEPVMVNAAIPTESRLPVLKEKPARRSFKQTVVLVCLAAVLGGTTLGAGLGLGLSLSNRFFIPAPSVEDAPTAFAFSNNASAVVPVNVSVRNFTEVIKSVAGSVVSINVTAQTGSYFGTRIQEGAGSGIIYAIEDERVLIATNNHVIEGVLTISISLDDEESVPAKVLGGDAASDLALLSVSKAELDALGVPYHEAVFGDSSLMQVCDEVVAIGNSMGEGKTATMGIVSAINKQITVEGKKLNVLQTDAAINPGNSGGALVNSEGKVIGINTAKFLSSDAEGMGYSIPSNDAIIILNQLQENGSVSKPYLGITPRSIDKQTQELFSLPSTGVLVVSVGEKSAAEKAGIMPRDLIAGYNDKTIASEDDLRQALSESKVGDEVVLKIYRNSNEPIEVKVVLGSLDEQQ